MADYTLEAQSREIVGKKVKRLRKEGVVPATIYGPKMEPLNVQFPYRPLQLMLIKAGGTHLIDIEVNGTNYPSLARAVQRHATRNEIQHVDFMAVDLNAKIRTEVPVHFVGQSPAIQAKKGVLITGPSFLSLEMLASKLIDRVEVDLEKLAEVGDTITVADLNLGPDVTIINEPEELIVRVVQSAAARSEDDLDALAEASSAEPEVISKGKGEEEVED